MLVNIAIRWLGVKPNIIAFTKGGSRGICFVHSPKNLVENGV